MNFLKQRAKSKTMWFGALFILNGIAQSFGFGDYMPGGEITTTMNFITGVLVWGLREMTTKPIKDK